MQAAPIGLHLAEGPAIRNALFRAVITAACAVIFGSHAAAQNAPPQIVTPDEVETSVGTLTLKEGVPSTETAQLLYDRLDLSRGIDTVLNAFSGVSMYAVRKGFRDIGVKDGDVLIFSKLVGSESLFLTANADTVYFWSYLNLRNGPIVVSVPPGVLGVIDDMWFRWISDFGVSGPDRGEGGKYLLLPPGYEGPLPEGGYVVKRSRTFGVGLIGRAFLEDNDPEAPVASVKDNLKIYAYSRGGYGFSVGGFLEGKSPLATLAAPAAPRFVEGSGKVMNTIPPNDYSYYQMLNSLVQEEPADALDPEIAGQFAAIGIRKDIRFAPDARMKRILEDAVAIGNVTSRVIGIRNRPEEGFAYYGRGSHWNAPLIVGGFDFMNKPAVVTRDGVKPFPATGARTLDARTAFFYLATVVTPAMCMNVTEIGSQYLAVFLDGGGDPMDGAKTYKLKLPRGIPVGKFWSVTLYDDQTRSMLQTSQIYPRAGSQGYPTPAAVADRDGSTTIYMSPEKPEDVKEGNWIQTIPAKGWFALLRFYNPTMPFFDKTWRPGEIQEVAQ
jgi:hypothetical protein